MKPRNTVLTLATRRSLISSILFAQRYTLNIALNTYHYDGYHLSNYILFCSVVIAMSINHLLEAHMRKKNESIQQEMTYLQLKITLQFHIRCVTCRLNGKNKSGENNMQK